MADRKDALTKRPLDFDREEETRKGETMKWLESHFGSESTSNDSRENDFAGEPSIEPTKKTYFNVTIKSNQDYINGHRGSSQNIIKTETKAVKPLAPQTSISNKTKYYQGISNWSDRKDNPANHFASKAFQEDLAQTVEINRLRRGAAIAGSSGNMHASRENLNSAAYVKEPLDKYVSREDILKQKRQSLSSQFLAKNRHKSCEELDAIETRRPSASTSNIRGSRQDLYNAREATYANGHSSKEYVNSALKTSTIDRSAHRQNSYERELNESSVVNEARRGSVEKQNLMDARPTVPQRRRAIEKKIRQETRSSNLALNVPLENIHNHAEPPPDYSPPMQSRSSSPQFNSSRVRETRAAFEPAVSTLNRKQNQRTRFAPNSGSSNYNTTARPLMATQTTQTASTISASTQSSQKSNRVGKAIGNSIRKLVNKIRSASAERKLRLKSRSKSREQSASPQGDMHNDNERSYSYQQYNVIDSHIGGQSNSNESEHESVRQAPHSNSTLRKETNKHFKNYEENGASNEEFDAASSPRQRFYLGEDPYSSSLYGKENIYDPNSIAKRNRQPKQAVENAFPLKSSSNGYVSSRNRNISEIDYSQKNTTTLGRFQKSSHRFAESTPNLAQNYRSTQTLPRKLHDQPSNSTQYGYNKNISYTNNRQGYSTLAHPERGTQYQAAAPAPAKPARTYAKVLNRSKSFNVHAMNGSHNPSPIYIEKLGKPSGNVSNLQSSQNYKSNPHLYSPNGRENVSPSSSYLQGGLKSPSIVNLISRSQRDLSKLDTSNEDELSDLQRSEKKHLFLRDLQRQAPDLYRTLHAQDEYRLSKPSKYQLQAKHSLDSRSPTVELNKDTASIQRREYEKNSRGNYAAGKVYMYKDETPPRSTVIAVTSDRRK